MSDKLAEVLIAAAHGIAAVHGVAKAAVAGAAKTVATAASTAQTTKPATTKPAATSAARPTAAKPTVAKPAAPPPAKVGKYSYEQVRNLIRAVATNDALGKQEASAILEEEASVQQISQVKPADYDKVAEACNTALAGVGGQTENEAVPAEEFDPTA
jgi:hypothetical protein